MVDLRTDPREAAPRPEATDKGQDDQIHLNEDLSIRTGSDQGQIEDVLSSARTEDLDQEREFGTPHKTEKFAVRPERSESDPSRPAMDLGKSRLQGLASLQDKETALDTLLTSGLDTGRWSSSHNDYMTKASTASSTPLESKIRKQREAVMKKYGSSGADFGREGLGEKPSTDLVLGKPPIADQALGRTKDYERRLQHRLSPATVTQEAFSPLLPEKVRLWKHS